MATNRRQKQICNRIQRKIAELLSHEVKDPRASFVTITSVSITQDLSTATIKYTVLEDRHRSKVDHMFKHANSFFRREVARDIDIRSAPKLKFEFDLGEEHAQRIEQILASLKPKDEA